MYVISHSTKNCTQNDRKIVGYDDKIVKSELIIHYEYNYCISIVVILKSYITIIFTVPEWLKYNQI
jgi:hypothetical protein